MNRLQWGLYRARKGLQHPRLVRLALRRRMIAIIYAKRIRQVMEIEWYAAKRGISGRGWRRVVYDYARRGFPVDTDPHPLFSARWYLHHNPKIVDEGINPIVHYLLIGERSGRSPHPLSEWMAGTLAIDVSRAMRLSAAGYSVRTLQIPEEITPKHRLLLGCPG